MIQVDLISPIPLQMPTSWLLILLVRVNGLKQLHTKKEALWWREYKLERTKVPITKTSELVSQEFERRNFSVDRRPLCMYATKRVYAKCQMPNDQKE